MKHLLKQIIPNSILAYYAKKNYRKNEKFEQLTPKEVFTTIYENNLWKNDESASGVGSTTEQTQTLITPLENCLNNFNINSILDIPCGDFNWMKNVRLANVQYLGADIVDDLISKNKANNQNPNVDFISKDLLSDQLPSSDLILIRDCLVHFSYHDIYKALASVTATKCKYLLTTSFVEHTINHDITTGDWRPINLQKKPFNFPKPILTIEEYFDPKYKKEAKGKSLCLWEIDTLKSLPCIIQK